MQSFNPERSSTCGSFVNCTVASFRSTARLLTVAARATAAANAAAVDVANTAANATATDKVAPASKTAVPT